MNTHFQEADLFSVAPMVDVTTSSFRRIARLFTKKAMLYTEMIAADAIVHGKEELLDFDPGEQPLTLQLGGSDPEKLAFAAKAGERLGYSVINLNAGCPSDKVQSGAFGAVMMKDPEHLADCIKAMQDAVSIPVTVKTRIGYDDCDSFEFTQKLIGAIHDAGCRHIIVHARKCWLNGLSPKENRTKPPLDYSRVYALKEIFPDTAFTINGGITSIEQCKEHLKHVDGVMLGREIIDNPYIMAEVDAKLFNNGSLIKAREQILQEAAELIKSYEDHGGKFRYMGQHLLNLFSGCQGARAYRRYLSEHLGDAHGEEVLLKAFSFCKRS